MCRWLAYSGSPVLIEEVLYKPEHSLIDQSLHSRMGAETTNGDGFGLGWYAPDAETPAVFHSIEPAWNDRNLREVASHVESPLFLAHIRASSGTAVQQTNCHPFRYGKWLWVHNGLVRDFHLVKRDLALAVDESLYPYIEGSADSETLFYLALTFGLEDDPPKAVERTVGFVEEVGRRHGIEHPIQMTIGTTDGKSLWGFRYSSEGKSRTLYYSTDMRTVRELYPDRPRLQEVSDETRLVVSEPLVDLPGAWNEVPESSYGVVRKEKTRCTRSAPSTPRTAARNTLPSAFDRAYPPAPPAAEVLRGQRGTRRSEDMSARVVLKTSASSPVALISLRSRPSRSFSSRRGWTSRVTAQDPCASRKASVAGHRVPTSQNG